MTKNRENLSPGDEKSKKIRGGGAFKRQQNAKLRKIADPSNYTALFLSILVENGSQDGGQNP